MSLAFQHAFSRMVLLLFSFGNNTESNSTSEGRGEAKQNNCEGQTVPLAIQHVFLGSGFIVFLSFGMRNFVPRLSPKNILRKFTYWYTMLYTTQISFAWANKHSASVYKRIGCLNGKGLSRRKIIHRKSSSSLWASHPSWYSCNSVCRSPSDYCLPSRPQHMENNLDLPCG